MPQDQPSPPPAAGGRVRARFRSLADFGDLLPAERRILAHAAGRDPDGAEFCEIASDRPGQMSDQNAVRGPFLRFLLLGGDDRNPVGERGIAVRGAWVVGPLDLLNCECLVPLRLVGCEVDQAINFVGARLKLLELSGTHVRGIFGDGVTCDGFLLLNDGFISDQPVLLFAAKIGGALECQNGTFKGGENAESLRCSNARIDGQVKLGPGLEAEHGVAFRSATIGGKFDCLEIEIENGAFDFGGARVNGDLDCRGSQFKNPSGLAIRGDGAQISGAVWLGGSTDKKPFAAVGEASFFGAGISGSVNCSDATFDSTKNAGRPALNFGSARVGGNVGLTGGLVAKGMVNFRGVDVKGSFDCSGAELSNPGGTALDCNSAQIGFDVWLIQGFEASGSVEFSGSSIGGELNCSGAKLNKQGAALYCCNAAIAKSVFLSGASANGTIDLSGSHVSGDLVCQGGNFESANAPAWNLLHIRVDGSIYLSPRPVSEQPIGAAPHANSASAVDPWDRQLKVTGGISLTNAVIGNDFNAFGFRVDRPATNGAGGSGKPEQFNSLDCSLSKFGGNCQFWLDLSDPVPTEVIGATRFYGARIGQNLELNGARFVNPGGDALLCDAVEVDGCVFLASYRKAAAGGATAVARFQSSGVVRFLGAKIGLDFNCVGGSFENAREDPDPEYRGCARRALIISQTTIGNCLVLGNSTPETDEESDAARILGSLDLSYTSVNRFQDEQFIGEDGPSENYFPKNKPAAEQKQSGGPVCVLSLVGFVYGDLAGAAVCTSKAREAWLGRQPPAHLAEDFRHQPFDQLVKVLRAMGRSTDARNLAIHKERLLTIRDTLQYWPRTVFGAPFILVPLWFGHWDIGLTLAALGLLVMYWRWFIDGFSGYGMVPGRAVAWVLLIVVVSGWFFDGADRQGLMMQKKEDKKADASTATVAAVCATGTADCREPVFRPYVYALDLVLPGALLGQADAWSPIRKPLKLMSLFPAWMQTSIPSWLEGGTLPDTFAVNWSLVVKLLGWLVSGTYLAGLAGLFGRKSE